MTLIELLLISVDGCVIQDLTIGQPDPVISTRGVEANCFSSAAVSEDLNAIWQARMCHILLVKICLLFLV